MEICGRVAHGLTQTFAHKKKVAKAGFIFDPNPEHPDNVTCYICTKALEGWCVDDDPLREHLKHSEDCGWAIAAAIEAHLPEWEEKNPMSEELLEARKKTFGEWWPYEKKKGWKCKVKQVSCNYGLGAPDAWGRHFCLGEGLTWANFRVICDDL